MPNLKSKFGSQEQFISLVWYLGVKLGLFLKMQYICSYVPQKETVLYIIGRANGFQFAQVCVWGGGEWIGVTAWEVGP